MYSFIIYTQSDKILYKEIDSPQFHEDLKESIEKSYYLQKSHTHALVFKDNEMIGVLVPSKSPVLKYGSNGEMEIIGYYVTCILY